MGFARFVYLGEDRNYNSEFENNFELVRTKPGRLPIAVYLGRFCDYPDCDLYECRNDSDCDVDEVEIGRCGIGSQWGTPWLYIADFEIAKPYRRKGHGIAFFDEVKDFAKRHGFSYIWLRPKGDDDAAYAFWQNLGGVHIDVEDYDEFVPEELAGSDKRRSFVFDLRVTDGTEED